MQIAWMGLFGVSCGASSDTQTTTTRIIFIQCSLPSAILIASSPDQRSEAHRVYLSVAAWNDNNDASTSLYGVEQ